VEPCLLERALVIAAATAGLFTVALVCVELGSVPESHGFS